MRDINANGEAREIIGVDAAGIGAGGRRADASPAGTMAPRTIARRRSRLVRRAPGAWQLPGRAQRRDRERDLGPGQKGPTCPGLVT